MACSWALGQTGTLGRAEKAGQAEHTSQCNQKISRPPVFHSGESHDGGLVCTATPGLGALWDVSYHSMILCSTNVTRKPDAGKPMLLYDKIGDNLVIW